MSQIKITNLSFAYEGSYDMIFENVSFQIDTAWKLGFVGRNGRGKTSFLRLLMGGYAQEGQIASSVRFAYFPSAVEQTQESVQALIQARAPQAESWEMMRELSLLGLAEDLLKRSFASLSGGEKTKVLLAALFLGEEHFLLIDEPTDHLDLHGRALVADYLNKKSGFILVSHDRSFLDACVTHILSINKTNIELQRGNFSSWQSNKERADAFERAEYEKLQREVKKLGAASKKSAAWSQEVEESKHGTRNAGLRPDRGYIGRKSAKMMKRAKNLEHRQQGALAEKEGLLKNVERSDALGLHPLRYHSKRLLGVQELSIAYEGKVLGAPISFELAQGERLALCGANGSGKSSLLRLLCGEAVPHSGVVSRGSGLIISYAAQETTQLSGSLQDYARACAIDETLLLSILRKLDFSREQLEKDMRNYSAGQKKKLLLAASLCQKAHLYIWDEPQNYIDVISRMQIEDLILAHQPSMLFVEHDKTFVERIATRTLWL